MLKVCEKYDKNIVKILLENFGNSIKITNFIRKENEINEVP